MFHKMPLGATTPERVLNALGSKALFVVFIS
jgi:hypothetical protein